MGAYPEFARLLNHYLTEQDRSLNWLARKLRHNASTIHRWVTEETRPGDRAKITAILDAFDIQALEERAALYRAAGYQVPDKHTTPTHEPALPKMTMQTAHYDFQAYDPLWVGRNVLVDELTSMLRNGRRLLLITGIAGIGKTALAERLALTLTPWLHEQTNAVTHLNFDRQTNGTDFVTVATKWLQEWKGAAHGHDIKQPITLLRAVIELLTEQRQLIIIDALEKIVTSDREGNIVLDLWWKRFFHDILATETLQGRVIITSQDLPVHLAEMGAIYVNRYAHQQLFGLSNEDQLLLFQRHGLDMTADSVAKEQLIRIGQIYHGHPLALRAIAGEIAQGYGSNVTAYWRNFGHEFELVEQALLEAKKMSAAHTGADSWRLDRFTTQLQRQVRHRLDYTFERLALQAPDAYLLLCTAAVYRIPVSRHFWLAQLAERGSSTAQQERALQSLQDRSLLEVTLDSESNRLFGMHNLIRSVALEHLKRL